MKEIREKLFMKSDIISFDLITNLATLFQY